MSIFKRNKSIESKDCEYRMECVSIMSRHCDDASYIIEEADKLFKYIKYGKEDKS